MVTAAEIDALLPQTQCTRCGYPACRPYAQAIASGEADFNQCPPGGQPLIEALATLLARTPKALNPANGIESVPRVAVIDEQRCIGCAKCLPACPVDAIVGARKYTHTVIADACSGCELCLPPCPVDCISLEPMEAWQTPLPLKETHRRATTYRGRYEAQLARHARDHAERQAVLKARKRAAHEWGRHDAGTAR